MVNVLCSYNTLIPNAVYGIIHSPNIVKICFELLESLKTASESIAHLQKAFSELNEGGHITVDTLVEIQKATGMTDDAFERYKNVLLTAKAGSHHFAKNSPQDYFF